MKTDRKKYWLFLMFMLGFQIQLVHAQYAEDVLRYSQLGVGVSARQLGMGNATVGGVDDYSALFWNPAGLALERNFEFSFGLSSHSYSNDVSYLGSKTSANTNVVNLNNLGLVYPIPTVRGSLTFAFGFNRAANYTTTASMNGFNTNSSFTQSDYLLGKSSSDNMLVNLGLAYTDSLGNVYPILNGNVQQAINVIEGGGLNHWSFGGSVDIAKNLSFGASLNYATGSYSYDQTVNENDTKNFYPASIAPRDFNQFTYESTINDEITGFNALLGLMFRYPEKYSIGFSIRTATTYSIKETYGESGSSQFKTLYQGESAYSFPLTSNSIKYEVTTPYTLSAGVSILPFEWLRLAGDAEYTDWTQMELRADGVDFSMENSRIKNQMRATVNLRGGGELSLLKLGLKLRGGIIYNPSPWKHDPSSRDQLYYTAGIGYMLDESTSIDAGFAYGTWKTLRTNYSYSAAGVLNDVGTDESVTTSNLNITLMVHF